MEDLYISKTEFEAHILDTLYNIERHGHRLIITDRGMPTLEIRKLRRFNRSPLERLKGSVLQYESPFNPISEDDGKSA